MGERNGMASETLISKIYKQLILINVKTTNNPMKDGQKT